MRPLIVTTDLHPSQGGPPRVIVSHALQLARRGISPLIAATVAPGQDAAVRSAWPELAEAGIEVRLLPQSGPARAGYSPGFGAFLAGEIPRIDLVHLHGVWEHCLAATARAAGSAGRPVVLQPHGMLDRWSRRRSRFRKAIASRLFGTGAMLRNVDAALFGTEEERAEADDLGNPWRPFLIPNGIDLGRVPAPGRPAGGTLFDDFPLLRGRGSRLLYFSRMHPKKGLELLLEAVARVLPTHPDLGLLVAAIPQDAGYEERMRQRAARDDLKGHVAISTEHTAERGRTAMQGADIFCLTSHQEGFSVAALEAMAHGLPVLLSDSCHMGFVRELGMGEVVPTDVDAIAAGLDRLLSAGPAARTRMGANARDWVARHATVERVGDRLAQIYGEIAGAGGTRTADRSGAPSPALHGQST